jgi:hypothetical protein
LIHLRQGRPPLLVAAAVLVLGCVGNVTPTGDPSRESLRHPEEQSFGPTYPEAPPEGVPIGPEEILVSADRMSLIVHFIGGKGYLDSDPCSEDYQPWLRREGGDVQVGIVNVDHPEQAQLGENMGCTAEGHNFTFRLTMDAPFDGPTVTDLVLGPVRIGPDSAPSST